MIKQERVAKGVIAFMSCSALFPSSPSGPWRKVGAIYLECAVCLSAAAGSPVDGRSVTSCARTLIVIPDYSLCPHPRFSDCICRFCADTFFPIL